MFKRILEDNRYIPLSEETKEKKKSEFITRLKETKDDTEEKEYRAIFRETFEITAKRLSKEHRKLFYESLGLPDEFTPYIDKIDKEVIEILISINHETKEEDKKARMSHLINDILRGRKDIPEKAFNDFTVK
ncbi:MAG: hypothetical protein LBO09_09365 [Candidatus Peribacteria bacterium]|jgi:hypothetical protein|nr:hypothetical protein [Candidatus Peribacteria bacterium]